LNLAGKKKKKRNRRTDLQQQIAPEGGEHKKIGSMAGTETIPNQGSRFLICCATFGKYSFIMFLL
jgi:hypothetical protein